MNEQGFWNLVERTRLRAGDQLYARLSTLEDELKVLPLEGLLAFHRHLLDAHRRAHSPLFDLAAALVVGRFDAARNRCTGQLAHQRGTALL